jgi:hypothetical protein
MMDQALREMARAAAVGERVWALATNPVAVDSWVAEPVFAALDPQQVAVRGLAFPFGLGPTA